MAADSIHQNLCPAYVYEIIVDGVVRYVGKGTGDRFSDHVRIAKGINQRLKVGIKNKRSSFYNKLADALRNGSDVNHRIIASELSNDDAFALEIKQIASAPNSQLWNKSPGGNGNSSEYLKAVWLNHPSLIDKQRDKALKGWQDNPEWRSARFRNPDSKAIQSEMVKAKWSDPEYREMQKRARAAGKKRVTVKFSEKRSALAKIRWADPLFRMKAIAGMKKAGADPNRRRAIVIRLKRQWADQAFRNKFKAIRNPRA